MTIAEKKTRRKFQAARHCLRYYMRREKQAIANSATGFVCGYEWHKPFHMDQLAKLQDQYNRLMTVGYL